MRDTKKSRADQDKGEEEESTHAQDRCKAGSLSSVALS